MQMSLGLFLPNNAIIHPLLTGKAEIGLKAISFKQCMLLPCELKFKHSGTCDNGFTVVLGGENFGSVPVRPHNLR